MKFFKKNGIYLIFIVLISLCCIVHAQDGDNAKRAAPRRPIGKSAKTTTTAAPADDEGDYPDGENPDQYGEEGEEPAPSSTTTEAPKKIGPVIRPFRSNDDFLNSLKRRQMDAKKNRAERQEHRSKPQHVEQNTDDEQAQPAAAPVAAAKSAKPAPGGALARRNKFSKSAKPEPQPEEQEAEGSEQEDKAEAKPKRPAHPRITLRKRA